MTKDKNYNYGEKYYAETGLSGFNKEDRMDHRGILEYGQIRKSDVVLEIGSGLGTLLERIPAEKKFGLESNNYAVKECQKKKLNVKKDSGVSKLPYEDNSFDVVIMNEVIEHIENPKKAVLEIRRILKKTGRYIITTPNRTFLVKNLAESHCSEMSYRQLEQLVLGAGMKITLHKVRGLSVWDYLGRKIVFPLGRLLVKKQVFSKSVEGVRGRIDDSGASKFRDNFIGLGSQQLLICTK